LYCPKRHGPLAAGMKNAAFSGSKSAAMVFFTMSPVVMMLG